MAGQMLRRYTLDSMTGHSTSTIHIFSEVSTVAGLPGSTVASAVSITGCDPTFFIVGHTYNIEVSQAL